MNEQKNESTNLITVRGELALLLIVIMNSFGVVLMLYLALESQQSPVCPMHFQRYSHS